MSTRYFNRWKKAFCAAGGHNGPATIAALRPRAAELAAAGISTSAAGDICAREYKSYRQIEDLKEEVSGLKWELRQ